MGVRAGRFTIRISHTEMYRLGYRLHEVVIFEHYLISDTDGINGLVLLIGDISYRF